MATLTSYPTLAAQECSDDQNKTAGTTETSEPSWEELYRLLTNFMRKYISSSGIASWCGQEQDLVEDIVQESICRVYDYFRKIERAEAPVVLSIYHFSKAVAYRYYQDRRRKDKRLVRSHDEVFCDNRSVDTIESLHEEMSREAALNKAAHIIVAFPPKQRQAVLRDLANRSADTPEGDEAAQWDREEQEEELEALERAFMAVNIRLADYQCALPLDRKERSRHASSLSIGYRKLHQEYCASGDSA